MGIKAVLWTSILDRLRFAWRRGCRSSAKGQAAVEFTLVFLLLIVVAWIPADFGLALYTGQLAQNAAREGARIAAADSNLLAQTGTCTMPCSSQPVKSVMAETAKRFSSALMPGATITVDYPVGTVVCNQLVRVRVGGNYNFFFYRLLKMFGVGGNLATTSVVHETTMRWEHQAGC